MTLNTLQNDVTAFIKENPLAVGIGAGAVALGAGAVVAGVILSNKKTKSGRKIKHTKRGWKQDRKRRSKQKWEVAYQKRKKRKSSKKKSRSKKGLHYTKKGQPYRILADGRARFVKKTKRRAR